MDISDSEAPDRLRNGPPVGYPPHVWRSGYVWRNRLDTPWRRARTHLNSLFTDHQILRLGYRALRPLSDEMWRANQPSPFQIRGYARMGVKTVVNLRGFRDCGSYVLESEACRETGLKMIDFPVKSRRSPGVETVREAKRLFETIAYPAVMHCKSGADRAGFMATLYCFFRLGQPLERAMDQLSWRYGHFKQAKAGVVDAFLEQYLEANRAQPIDFIEWLETKYDPAALERSFHALGAMSRFTDSVLRRE